MKIIFLSVLASTALSVLSYKSSFNPMNYNKGINSNENANKGFLEENKKNAINPNYVHTGSVSYYVTPDKLRFFTGHGSSWYELLGSVQISGVESRDWGTVQFEYYNDYSTGNFYRDDVWFDENTGEFSFFICTDNENAEGYIDFVFTYEHDPNLVTWNEPVDSDGIVHKDWTGYQPQWGEFVSKGISDLNIENAKEVSETFSITGTMEEVNWFSYLVNGFWPPEKDSDWYKFEVKQKIKYKCKFNAPNSYYSMSLHKLRFKSGLDTTTKKIFSCNGTTEKEVTLDAGTYYICVTMTDKSKIVSNRTYKIDFTCSQHNNYFPIYYNNLKNFEAVVWESDFIPDNITNRWSSNDHELKWQDPDGTTKWGYYDTVFDESTLTPDTNLLDSVIYFWGSENMLFLQRTLESLRVLLRQKKRELMRYKQIAADIQAIGGGIINLILTGVSIGSGVKEDIVLTTIDDVNTLSGGMESLGSIGEAIADLVLGSVPEEIDYLTEENSALSELIGALNGHRDAPNGVIAIPVYGRVVRAIRDDGPNGTRDSWTYYRSFVPYGKRYLSDETTNYPSNPFRLGTIGEVQRMRTYTSDVPTGVRTFHGSLKSFTGLRKLRNYINYDYIIQGNI